MSYIKARKTSTRMTRAQRQLQEELVDRLIDGLDALAAQADAGVTGTASRILFAAKEELVHWAVTMNFHESAQDRYINQRLYATRDQVVAALLAQPVDEPARDKVPPRRK